MKLKGKIPEAIIQLHVHHMVAIECSLLFSSCGKGETYQYCLARDVDTGRYDYVNNSSIIESNRP